MGTDWYDSATVADGFDAYDDLPERILGYPQVFARLGLGDPDVTRVLDYGCGPGKVALRMADEYGDLEVTAADISAPMLRIARARRPHPRIHYHLLTEARLPLPADSMDAALSAYVFINIPDLDTIRAITTEVHRVLRPGARYTILDTNPDTTGVPFTTFRSGDPGRHYLTGEHRRVLLHQPGGNVLELIDHHWPRQTYADVLTDAGFAAITFTEPLLDDVADPGTVRGTLLDTPEPAEATTPPFLIVTGVKP
ncbi:class I SAM-dependent methyltransferase [Streptomyces sp. NPDC002520]